MSSTQFDIATRELASGLPRRKVVGLLTRMVLGSAAVLVTGSTASAQPGCRNEGHPCEGNQTCCPGLICAESEKGSAKRCTAASTNECESDCSTSEPDIIVAGVDVDIDVDCAYSGETRRTTCTFSATGGNTPVSSVVVPKTILCAEVVGGDFEEIALVAAGGSERETGLKSTRTEDATAIVTVELEGEITTASTATYWCEIDRAELAPVTGPGLSCSDSLAAPATDVPASTGTVIVHVYDCGAASADMDISWFDACQISTNPAEFQLTPLDDEVQTEGATQSANAEGMLRFDQLPPGTYRLEQTDGDWCHAESDNVDEQGNIVVLPAEVATVWVFDCAGGS